MTDTIPSSSPPPSLPHRATPEQWDRMTVWCFGGGSLGPRTYASVILELRARVEALEAQQAQPSQPAAPAEDAESGLVEQVAYEIASDDALAAEWLPEARDAIRVVARWLRANPAKLGGWDLQFNSADTLLEQEAGR